MQLTRVLNLLPEVLDFRSKIECCNVEDNNLKYDCQRKRLKQIKKL